MILQRSAPIQKKNPNKCIEFRIRVRGKFLGICCNKDFYPQFPIPHNFWKLYFSKKNFKGPGEALKVINERFHINKVHWDILVFPNLADDYIYKYTFLHPHPFVALQWKLDQWIAEQNALCNNQYAFELHYSIVETHPYLLQTIL